jgi:hypothetical protein
MAKNTNLPKGMKSSILALVAIGLLWTNFSHAQESTNASGGDGTGSGGSVAYSVGLVVYTTNSNSAGSAAHGVQHAYEIGPVGINESELKISLTVFPNPSSDNLTLHIGEYNNEELMFQLFDMQGKLLNNGRIVAQQTQINMKALPQATYLMQVLNQENRKIQSFKIVKH